MYCDVVFRNHMSRDGIDSADLGLRGNCLTHWIVGDMQDFSESDDFLGLWANEIWEQVDDTWSRAC